jgi:hypothetical protein
MEVTSVASELLEQGLVVETGEIFVTEGRDGLLAGFSSRWLNRLELVIKNPSSEP